MAFLNIRVKSELSEGEFRQRVANPIEAALVSAAVGTVLTVNRDGDSYALMIAAPNSQRAHEIIQGVLQRVLG